MTFDCVYKLIFKYIVIGKPEEKMFVTNLTDVVQFKQGNSTLLLIQWKVRVYCCPFSVIIIVVV